LANAADRLAQGDLKIRLAVAGADDMTDLVCAFNEMAAALESNVEQLRQTEARARRFAADVSHELRTPLAAMTAVTDVLTDQADSFHGDAAAAARLVSRETKNLNRLVEDLIEISRFDAGSARLATEDIELTGAVRDCLRVRNWVGEVVTDLPAEGLILRVDPRRLDVILANLVGNALRHGAPPVILAVRVERRGGGDWAAIRVSDCGAGLAPEAMPHVFERFYKADTARTRSEGSGLGLAIAWENVTLHGGTIEVFNLARGGAQFTVRLPCTA
jgi:two-component system sensor histidine kinase MtrB